MPTSHPTILELEAFFQSTSRSTVPVPLSVVRHLLSGCQACCKALQDAGWSGPRLDRYFHLAALETTAPGYDYQQTFISLERRLAASFAPELTPAGSVETLLATLLQQPSDVQFRLAAGRNYGYPSIVRALIHRGYSNRFEDPAGMLHLVHLALVAAQACTPETAGSPVRREDLLAEAWEKYGNALRIHGLLVEADDALATARRHCSQGTRDPLLRARILEHLASLRTFQRRFEEAAARADESAAIYREIGRIQDLASSLVHKAISAVYAGETEAAITILNQAIPLVDPHEQPQLLLAACHNLIRCYIDAERPEQALSLYYEARDLYREFDGHATILLRTAWQEGQILRDFGHLAAAEAALQRARQGFHERGLLYEVALVSLDLAAVYVRLGKTEELRQTATEAIPIFRALRVERETLGSLLQLRQAAGQEKQALELIRLLSAQIEPLAKGRSTR